MKQASLDTMHGTSIAFSLITDNTDNNGEPVWHGFPIKWPDLPTEAKNKLIANGTLTNTLYRKVLRKPLGLEPDS